jgi:hypothetical protein
MECIRSGSVTVSNPFNTKQIRKVFLDPSNVEALVFWTRDPRPLFPYLAELDERGYRYYFMTTLTGYPKEIEPKGIPAAQIVEAMSALCDAIGSSRSIWRYDPVFLSNITDEVFHLRNFEALAKSLEGKVERVVLSVYDEYKKVKKRMNALSELGIELRSPYDEGGRLSDETTALLGKLGDLSRAAGIEPRSCAEPDGLQQYGIEPNACVDAALIKRLWGIDVGTAKDRYQRPACRCAVSVDIGAYNTCPAGCVYCYATR